ncbi:MAG: beta strand repeat-containing protein, partial [Candidatus Chromulinivorax sp.]
MKNIKQLLRSIFFIYCITFLNSMYSSNNPYNYATPAASFLNNSASTISGTFYNNSGQKEGTLYSLAPGYYETNIPNGGYYGGAGFVTVSYNGYTITIYTPGYSNSSLALFSSGSITNQSTSNVSINFYNTPYSTTPINSSQFALNANQNTYFFYGSNQVTIYDSNNNAVITNYPISPFANYNLNYTNGSWSLDLTSVNYTLTNNSSFALSNLYFYTDIYPYAGFMNSTAININPNSPTYLPAYAGYFTASYNNSFLFIPVPNDGTTSYSLFDTGNITNSASSSISVYYYDSNFFNNQTDTYNTITLSSEPTTISSQGSAPTFYGCNQITIYDSNNAPTNISNYTISSSQNYVVNYSNGTWSITVANTLTNNNTTEPVSNLIFYDDANSSISSATSLAPYGNITIPLNATSFQGTMYSSNITLPVSSTVSSNIFDSGLLTNDSGEYAYVTFYDASQTAINSTPIQYWPDATLPIFTGTQFLTIYNSSLVAQVTMTPIAASDNYYIYIAANAGSAWYLSSQQNTEYTVINNNTVSQNFTDLIFYDSSNNPITTAVTLAPNDSILIPNNASYYTGTANGSLCTVTLPTSITSNLNIFSTTTDYNYITNNSGQTVYLNFYTSNGTLMNTPAIEMTNTQVIQTLTNAANVAVYTDAAAEENVIASTPILAEIYYESGIWFLSKNALSSYYFTNNSNQTITNVIYYDGSSMISSPVTLTPSATLKIPNHTTTVKATYFNATITLAISYSQDWNLCDSGSITNQSGIELYFNFYNGSTLLNNTPIAVPNESTIDILTGTTNVTVTDGGSQTVNSTITPTQDYWINQSDGIYYITGTTPTSYIFTNNATTAISNLNFHQSSGAVISSTITVNAGQALTIPNTAAYITGTLTSYSLLLPLAYPTQSSSTTLVNNSALYNTTTEFCYVNFYDTSFSVTALTTPYFGIAENVNTPIFYGTNQISVYDQNGNIQITNASIISSGTYYINNNGTDNNIWSLSTTAPTPYVVDNNSNTQMTNVIFYNSANQAVSIATTLPAQSTIITPSTATYVKGNYNGTELTITLNNAANTDIFASGTITNNSGSTLYINFYTDNTINTTTLLNQSPITATNTSVTAILSGTTNIAIYQDSAGTQLLTSGTIGSDTINYYINNTNGTYYISGTSLTSNTFTNNSNS